MVSQERNRQTAVLADSIDFHVHAGPSYWDRKHDAIELAERLRKAGVGGAVFKSHFGSTFAATELAESRVPEVDIYSSVTLNPFVGGFNPSAVELAVKSGVSVVWLPTFSAAHFETTKPYPFAEQSMRATDELGEAKSELRAVVETLGDTDRSMVLGNGHLSPEETRAVFDVVDEVGGDVSYLITHADSAFMELSTDDQVELAERGAVVEKCYLSALKGDIPIADVVESIDEIGVENCVLSTDHGQPDNASPPEAFKTYLSSLREHGLSEEELRTMACENPRSILSK